MKYPLRMLISAMNCTVCYWDLNPWLCCYTFLFFLIFFLMLSGISDNPDRTKTFCSFRGKEPIQRHTCREKEVWEPDASFEGGCRSWYGILRREYPCVPSGPPAFVLSGFCSSSLTWKELSWWKSLQETRTVGNSVPLALILWNNATSNEVSFFVTDWVLWSRTTFLFSKYNSGD